MPCGAIPVHEALEVVGHLDGTHLRSVLVKEDEVIDTLKVFVSAKAASSFIMRPGLRKPP